MAKLTPRQREILQRAPVGDRGERPLYTYADDRVAKNMARKGLGFFTDFRFHYIWRRRDGYINLFTPWSDTDA